MHHINRKRHVHDCLDKKIATPPHLLDLEKCVTPKGHFLFRLYHLFLYIILVQYTVLECPMYDVCQSSMLIVYV
jgi:hypothetical protein